MIIMDGNILDVNDRDAVPITSASPVLPQLYDSADSGRPLTELLCDTWDAARSLHDETHLNIREAVLFSLGTAFICCGHVQVEAQRH